MIDAPAAAECPTCHAPLASDQRYCVYCGTRAPQVRLEFIDALRAPPYTPAAASAAPAAPASDRWGVPLLAVIAALGVGALLGHWATPQEKAAATAPATQVIRVTGDAPPAAAAPTATPGATATATAEATATPAKKDTGAAPDKDLSKDSIKKAVKGKAPISTGGAPPPKDDKKPAGGADFETIG